MKSPLKAALSRRLRSVASTTDDRQRIR